jgi:hypothetical protein
MKKQLLAILALVAITMAGYIQAQKSIVYNDTYKFDLYKYLTAKDINDLKAVKTFTLTNVDKFAKPGSPQVLIDANGNIWAKKTGAFFTGTSSRGYETWNIVAIPAIQPTSATGRTAAAEPSRTPMEAMTVFENRAYTGGSTPNRTDIKEAALKAKQEKENEYNLILKQREAEAQSIDQALKNTGSDGSTYSAESTDPLNWVTPGNF